MAGDEVTIAAGEQAAPGPALAPRRLGRYVLLEELGRGGMGAVFGAYDPELDRKIAVKVLTGDGGDARRQQRLLREAQALARLAHPNVVAVHDVGLIDGHVYVAMEYVQGESLRAWLERRRSLPELMDMFIQAGRGLAAAHAVGLVHRDFKPDNVVVGRDGRARVLDFGLAALAGAPAAEPVTGPLPALAGQALADAATLAEPSSHVPKNSLLSSRLTAVGALMGTLAYMSPEQYAGAELDAATDQFSFCVALYEAVCGQRPFAGESAPEYALAVTSGVVRPAPRGAEAPRWLLRALQRGLAVDPRARFPDMPALLAELSRDRGRVRRGLWAAGAAAVAAAGLFAATRTVTPVGEARCSGAASEFAAVWDEGRRAALERAFTATGLAYAAETLARVGPRLDALGERWAAVHTATCQAHLRGELSDALFDREMTCLKGQLKSVAARVEVLARADAAAVERAVEVVDGLPAAADCRDPDLLLPERLVPADAELAAEVAALRERLVEIDAEIAAGHYATAGPASDAVVAAARATGELAIVAEAESIAAAARHSLAEYREARTHHLAAFFAATEIDHLAEATAAALALLSLDADELSDAREGALWRSQALALVRRSRGEDTRRGVSLRVGMAELAYLEETREEALRLASESVALAERIAGPDDMLTAAALGAAGRIHRNYGLLDEAHRDYGRAREIMRRTLGDNHPELAPASHNLGAVLEELGRHAEAEAVYFEAIRLIERSIGPQAAALGFVHNNLSDLYTNTGDLARAEVSARKALEIFEREFGPEHPRTGLGLNNLGTVVALTGREAEALPLFERSVAIYEKTLGPDRYDIAFPLHGLGVASLGTGDLTRAEALFRRSLALTAAAVGPDGEDTAPDHLWLGRCLLLQGRHREAIASLERASALWSAKGKPSRAGEAQFMLAQALWAAGGKGRRARAREEAERAAAGIIDGDPHVRTRLAEVTAWLATHELP